MPSCGISNQIKKHYRVATVKQSLYGKPLAGCGHFDELTCQIFTVKVYYIQICLQQYWNYKPTASTGNCYLPMVNYFWYEWHWMCSKRKRPHGNNPFIAHLQISHLVLSKAFNTYSQWTRYGHSVQIILPFYPTYSASISSTRAAFLLARICCRAFSLAVSSIKLRASANSVS